MKILNSAAIALTGLAAPALAGGLDPVPVQPVIVPATVPAAPIYNFTGLSAGLALGYATSEFDDGDSDVSFDGDGGFIGARLNYDYDFGTAIVGGTLQYDNLGLSVDNDDDPDLNDQLESIYRAGLRLGVDSGRNMYYLTGGWAQANLEDGGESDGYFAGVGYEVFLTDNITAGAELLTHEFDDFDSLDADDIDDGDLTTFALSVNYRF
ncbi:MAG: outer membrane protein [Hasllibacter sp.]